MKQILLIGCGKMGGAILEGWLAKNAGTYDIHVVDHADTLAITLPPGASVTHHHALKDVPDELDPVVILFAVKPQILKEVIRDCFQEFGTIPLYISVAAGKTLAYYQAAMADDVRIVRAMPNTPALVGRGVTVMTGSDTLEKDDRHLCSTLMEACGIALWLDDESKMDVVTAISGSGPAYVFYFMECLIRAAQGHGLSEDFARTLVTHLLLGSSELAHQSSDPADILRRNVTSPGGTTEAALEHLMNPSGMLPLIQQAVEAAITRAGQLSGQP